MISTIFDIGHVQIIGLYLSNVSEWQLDVLCYSEARPVDQPTVSISNYTLPLKAWRHGKILITHAVWKRFKVWLW